MGLILIETGTEGKRLPWRAGIRILAEALLVWAAILAPFFLAAVLQ